MTLERITRRDLKECLRVCNWWHSSALQEYYKEVEVPYKHKDEVITQLAEDVLVV